MSHVWVKISNFRPTLETIRDMILQYREDIVSEIVSKYIGKTFVHGIIFKKTYKIETREDAIKYIIRIENSDYYEWHWEHNAYYNSVEKIDELLTALRYSDEEFAQISVKDIKIATSILKNEKYKNMDIGLGKYA